MFHFIARQKISVQDQELLYRSVSVDSPVLKKMLKNILSCESLSFTSLVTVWKQHNLVENIIMKMDPGERWPNTALRPIPGIFDVILVLLVKVL